MECKVTVFALSTCSWCKKMLTWLEDKNIVCETHYMDTIKGEKREKLMAQLKEHNPRRSFPTAVFDGGRVVVIGFKPGDLEKAVEE